MKRLCVVGHFAFGKELLNGQTIKTKIITEELEKQLGKSEVATVDTHSWKVYPCKVFNQVRNAARTCENIIMMPAHNGVLFFAPLLYVLKRIYRIKISYIVIGGWLPDLVRKKKLLRFCLKNFDGIYVETNIMKCLLEKQGFNNIFIMPNCKKIKILKPEELVYPSREPYKLCTFSRVMKEKGIETAINVIKNVNNHSGYMAYSLDIYGQVDATQIDWFENLKGCFPAGVQYCGCVDSDKSVNVLQQYFALLFPTHFYTEGIPGTIIDAYAAGLPVISAKWESCLDIVDDGETGLCYEFNNEKQLENILWNLAQNPQPLLDMKKNCIEKAKGYVPEMTLEILKRFFEGEEYR